MTPDPEGRLISCSAEDLGFTDEEWLVASDSDKEEAIMGYIEDEDKADWMISNISDSETEK